MTGEDKLQDCRPEVWVRVPGASRYEVSNNGRIRTEQGLRKTQRGQFGYHRLNLTVDQGHRRMRDVHRLVCEAFHGLPPDPKSQARHLNGDREDNRAENLAWGTARENQQDMLRHGTHWSVAKTHCKHGHAFDEANTIVTEGRRRDCRACRSRRHQEQRARIAAGVKAPPPSGQRTHCPRGHEYTPENTYHGGGYRQCRKCRNEITRMSRKRRFGTAKVAP